MCLEIDLIRARPKRDPGETRRPRGSRREKSTAHSKASARGTEVVGDHRGAGCGPREEDAKWETPIPCLEALVV